MLPEKFAIILPKENRKEWSVEIQACLKNEGYRWSMSMSPCHTQEPVLIVRYGNISYLSHIPTDDYFERFDINKDKIFTAKTFKEDFMTKEKVEIKNVLFIDFSEIPVILKRDIVASTVFKLDEFGYKLKTDSISTTDEINFLHVEGGHYSVYTAEVSIGYDAVYDFDKIVEILEDNKPPEEVIVMLEDIDAARYKNLNIGCKKDGVMIMGTKYDWRFVDELVKARQSLTVK